MSARTLRIVAGVLGLALLAIAAGLLIGWTWVGNTSTAAKSGVSITSVKATPGQIEPIDVLTIGTGLHNAADRLDNVTVELTVYDQAGNAVLHEKQSSVGLSHDADQAVYWIWRIPQRLQDGPYAVGIAVYDTGSRALLARNDQAATFRVARSGDR